MAGSPKHLVSMEIQDAGLKFRFEFSKFPDSYSWPYEGQLKHRGHFYRRDLPPAFWTAPSCKIPVLQHEPERGAEHEEVEIF